jgi:hypothetical protein
LVSRRTFVFARAGFGKSNLNKLLFSELYRGDPHVTKRGGRKVLVGTIIFDPDGEYFWPDDKDRPGLADVPHLKDKLVVFTSRQAPSRYYESFVAAGVVKGRSKPATSGRLKTSHFEEFSVRRYPLLSHGGIKERWRGESTQNGNGGSNLNTPGSGLVTAADRP